MYAQIISSLVPSDAIVTLIMKKLDNFYISSHNYNKNLEHLTIIRKLFETYFFSLAYDYDCCSYGLNLVLVLI